MKIKLTKIGLSADPLFPTPLSTSFIAGQDNGLVSVPVDYWVLGTIENKPEVGKPLVIARTNRNGVESFGIMSTSTIQTLTENGFETFNSKYKIEYLD